MVLRVPLRNQNRQMLPVSSPSSCTTSLCTLTLTTGSPKYPLRFEIAGGRITYLIKCGRWRRTRWGRRGRRNWHPCPARSWHCSLSVLICSFRSLIYLQIKQKFMRTTLPLETVSTRRTRSLGMTSENLSNSFPSSTVT